MQKRTTCKSNNEQIENFLINYINNNNNNNNNKNLMQNAFRKTVFQHQVQKEMRYHREDTSQNSFSFPYFLCLLFQNP